MGETIRVHAERAIAFTVVNGCEFGQFFVIEHRHPDRLAVTLAIHSSFGVYGHHWSNFGDRSLARALGSLDFHYAMNKLVPSGKYRIFDKDKAVAWARRKIIELRKTKCWDHDKARIAWEDVDSIEYPDSPDLFMHEISEIFGSIFWDHQMSAFSASIEVDDPQCVGLWRELWPHFIAALRAREEMAVPA